jgi:phosphate uptake regulator
MFRSIIGFWKGRAFLEEVLEDFSKMLTDSEEIYGMVVEALRSGGDATSLGQRIYTIDRQINMRQIEIRRRIVEHMAVQPHADLRFSLILMSVVKDAERLGDYVKNLFEIFELHDGPFDAQQLERALESLPEDVGKLFHSTRVAFVESKEDVARKVIGDYRRLTKHCNDVLEEVSHNQELTVNDAVCLALLARFLKRVAAHLGNIATSVVMPVDRLDYYDERRSPRE